MQLGNAAVDCVQIGLHRVDVGRRPLQQQNDVLQLGHQFHHALQLLDGLGVAILHHIEVEAVLLQNCFVGVKAHLLFQLRCTIIQLCNAVFDLRRRIQQGVQLIGGSGNAVQRRLHLGQSCPHLCRAAGQGGRIAVQSVNSRLYLCDAVRQCIGAVVHLHRAVLQLRYHAGQINIAKVEVQIQPHTVQ